EAVDPGLAERREPRGIGGAGIRFERDLGVWGETRLGAHAVEQARDRGTREEARRAAAQKHGLDRPALRERYFRTQVAQQRVDVVDVAQRAARLVRIEVAVRALADAPRQVHVERERRQRLEA